MTRFMYACGEQGSLGGGQALRIVEDVLVLRAETQTCFGAHGQHLVDLHWADRLFGLPAADGQGRGHGAHAGHGDALLVPLPWSDAPRARPHRCRAQLPTVKLLQWSRRGWVNGTGRYLLH